MKTYKRSSKRISKRSNIKSALIKKIERKLDWYFADLKELVDQSAHVA